MKSASRFLSVITLALAAGMVVSCVHTETFSDYPSETEIPARQISATHTLNRWSAPASPSSQIDAVVHFTTGSDKLSAEDEAIVEKVAAFINSPSFTGGHVTVEGYTDAKGKPAKNVKLSYHRALAVVHALEAHGVSASLLSAQGYGEANPVATNSTGAGRAANRRVTFNVSGSR
jgi:outer membrane protein OmpA-like peptidoglycan-associated protein